MKTTNRILRGTAVAVTALVISSASLAAANTPQTREERGTIKEVDMNHHQLVVTDRKNNSIHRFQWNEQTKFTEHWKKAAPTALRAGERVRLTYAPGGDIPLAQKVQLAPAKVSKHASAHYQGASKS